MVADHIRATLRRVLGPLLRGNPEKSSRARPSKMASALGHFKIAQYTAISEAKVGDLLWIEWLPFSRFSDDSDDVDAVHDENGDENDGQEDGEHDGDENGQDGDSDNGHDDSEVDEDSESEHGPPPAMYLVRRVIQDSKDKILGIHVSLLDYSSTLKPGEHVYHIFGKHCVARHRPNCTETACNILSRIESIVTDEHFKLTLNPHGDRIRHRVVQAGLRCILECHAGFLDDGTNLATMIRGFVPPIIPAGARLMPTLCPICLGKSLVLEQQRLISELLEYGLVDMGLLVEFYGRLNTRLRELNLGFRQMDEREWGMHFDDMLSDSEEEEEGDVFEEWEEAFDPNNEGARPRRPASDETIAALQRRVYDMAEAREGDERCVICLSDFEDGDKQIEFPCGHRHFHEACAAMWLKQYANCPTDRHEILPMPDKKDQEAAEASLPDLVAADSVMNENNDIENSDTEELVEHEEELVDEAVDDLEEDKLEEEEFGETEEEEESEDDTMEDQEEEEREDETVEDQADDKFDDDAMEDQEEEELEEEDEPGTPTIDAPPYDVGYKTLWHMDQT